MSDPLVSVVLVTCNVEAFLSEAIESILKQSFTGFEFIIVDFGSCDRSYAIAEDYAGKDSRIKLHTTEKRNLAEVRNVSCALARGKYIAIMDADDVAMPDRLRKELEFMEANPDVAVVGGATEWIDAKGRSLGIHNHPRENSEIQIELLRHFPYSHPTVLLRKEAFASIGGYRSLFEVAQDYDLILRIAEQFRCANLADVLLRYRIHSGQVSIHKREQQTMSKLAAQVSALARRNGDPDPLDGLAKISATSIAGLGVDESMRQRHFFQDCLDWVRNMIGAGEYAVALKTAKQLLESSSWKHVPNWKVSDLWYQAAKLHWKSGEALPAFAAMLHALAVRPVLAGRPLMLLLRRIGAVSRRRTRLIQKVVLGACVSIGFAAHGQTGLSSQWIAYNRAGAGNSNLQCFLPRNVNVTNGNLVITTKAETASCSSIDLPPASYQYTSGFIQMRSFNFLYGTIEFRAKFGGGQNSGSWPTVWMLDASCQQSDPTGTDDNCTGQEIDIAEILGGDFTHINQQIHVNSFAENDQCTPSASDTSQNFHTYQLIWAPGSLIFKIDNTTTCTINKSYVPNAAMYVKVSVYTGNSGGPINNSTLPWTTLIDYVKVTQNSTVVFFDDFGPPPTSKSKTGRAVTF